MERRPANDSRGLLQIHEPLKPRGQAVSIDLGTNNSLVAGVLHGKPHCLSVDEDGSLLLPSPSPGPW